MGGRGGRANWAGGGGEIGVGRRIFTDDLYTFLNFQPYKCISYSKIKEE